MTFINPENLPPEVIAALEAHMDRQRMAYDVNTHEFFGLFHELKKEQLEVLRRLLGAVLFEPNNAAFFQGIATEVLRTKHNTCPCGSSHSAEDLLENEKKEPTPEAPLPDQTGKTRAELMKEYNLHVKDGTLCCKTCGMTSVSLEDRMLRPVGVKGCPGCQEKAKWG